MLEKPAMACFRVLRIARRRSAHALFLAAALAACGGGSDPEPTYSLTIDGPAQRSTTTDRIVLTGNAFVPPGSHCPGGGCGMTAPLVHGQLGMHQLTWANAANGLGGPTTATWVCSCNTGAPYWSQDVPLAPGPNSITMTMSAGGRTDQAAVTVTRQ